MLKKLISASIILMYSCRPEQVYEPPYHRGVSVYMQHNDNCRSGLNNRETVLNTSNVNSKLFGKLFVLPVDDQVYAQPLVVSGLYIADSIHDVVYIATVNNTVYAYDADKDKLYWTSNYTQPGMRPVRNTDMTGACSGNYQDFTGNIGIVGTPVIDSVTRTMYFVARSTNAVNFVEYLHAIDIITGADRPGSPVEITASCKGQGDGSVNGILTFDAQKENQRQALSLVNGIVYVSFAGHCDWAPYHGWILGYDASTLAQRIVYNDTPEGDDGGIWESGMGMASDNQGNLYAAVGNGTVGLNGDPTDLTNRGESALKLTTSDTTLKVLSYFTPDNYQYLEAYDFDYGSMGALLIPQSGFFLTGGKDGSLYLLDKDNMGGFVASGDGARQHLTLGPNMRLHCQPAYYSGPSGDYVFVWSENDQLRAIPFNRTAAMLDMAQEKMSSVTGPTGRSGAVLSVSSNATLPNTGIVWASHPVGGDANVETKPGILRAFDASDVSRELWNNSLNPDDAAGNYAKFCSPTIANGHVYLATFSNQVVVYGLKE